MTTETVEAKLGLKPEDALQMEFQAHLTEYERLYEGMLNSMEGARQVLVHSLLISAGAVPVLTVLIQQRAYAALLLLPIVFSSAAWLFQYHLYYIFVASTYIQQVLIPKAEAIARPTGSNFASKGRIWEFEFVFSTLQVRGWKRLIFQGLGSFLTLVAILLLILPGVISLGVFLTIRNGAPWEWWETSLFILDIVLMMGGLGFSAVSPYLAKQYFD